MTRKVEVPVGVGPVILTLILLGSRLDSVPALSDPVAGSVPPSIHLAIPTLYLVLAPVFTAWDGISMLSMSRLQGFLIGLAGLYLIWRILRQALARRSLKSRSFWLRELTLLAISLGSLVVFLLVGAMWHRPMLSLAGVPRGDLVVDFHSHTNASHDVRDTWMRHFDVAANLRWHARAGFDAVFVTDHNVVSRQSTVASRQLVDSLQQRGARGATVPCPGIEVSAWQAHIVLLGDTLPVDRDPYSGSLSGLLRLLRISDSAYSSLSVASLPEYRRSHWNRLDTLVDAGLDGFEIVNASPKANELSIEDRNRVVDLARLHDRFVVGVSDNHGWGATSMVWNLMQVPRTDATLLCSSILTRLGGGFPAVRILERHRLRADDRWPMWLTPLGVLWETWRSMGWRLTLSWIVWIWLLGALSIALRRRRLRAKIAA
jgi:hypothetical protein